MASMQSVHSNDIKIKIISSKNSNKCGLCEMTSGLRKRLTYHIVNAQGQPVAVFKVVLWSSLGWMHFQANW